MTLFKTIIKGPWNWLFSLFETPQKRREQRKVNIIKSKPKAAIGGCGNMGLNHARILNLFQKQYGYDFGYFSVTDNPMMIDGELYTGKEVADLKIENINEKLFQKIGRSLKGYPNFEAMIKEEKPEIVVISSPDSAHLSNIEYCINQGVKRIYCEKPLATAYQVPYARKIMQKIRANDIDFGLNLQLAAIGEQLQNKKVFGDYTYKDIVNASKYSTVDWASCIRDEEKVKKALKKDERIDDPKFLKEVMDSIYTQNELDSIGLITDLIPHSFTLISNINLKNARDNVHIVDGQKEVLIKFPNGEINLSRKETRGEANKCRRWSFETGTYCGGGIHTFEYTWQNGKCMILHFRNDNLCDEPLEIEDPLAYSIKSFLAGKKLVNLKNAMDNLYNLEAAVKSHRIYNVAKTALEKKWKLVGAQNYDILFRMYWPCLNEALKDEEVRKQCSTISLEDVVKYVPAPNPGEILSLSSKLEGERAKQELVYNTKEAIIKRYQTA